jgi:hypothetical protein
LLPQPRPLLFNSSKLTPRWIWLARLAVASCEAGMVQGRLSLAHPMGEGSRVRVFPARDQGENSPKTRFAH